MIFSADFKSQLESGESRLAVATYLKMWESFYGEGEITNPGFSFLQHGIITQLSQRWVELNYHAHIQKPSPSSPSQVPQPTCYWTFMAVGEPDYSSPDSANDFEFSAKRLAENSQLKQFALFAGLYTSNSH